MKRLLGTNSNFLIIITLHSDVADLWFFKLWILHDQKLKFEILEVYDIKLQRYKGKIYVQDSN